jgi:type VI secretion system VasD/TssJ family lipoprotein
MAFMVLASCAAWQQAGRGPGKDAVSLAFEADRNLNWRGGEPHTLALCVYQLSDTKAFEGLAANEDGLHRLLQCTGFDPSVVAARRVIVQPGKGRRVTMDRAEGARYVGIVAGYYAVDRDRVVRILRIPLQEQGTFFKTMVPAPLKAALRLGPKEILPSP